MKIRYQNQAAGLLQYYYNINKLLYSELLMLLSILLLHSKLFSFFVLNF